MSENYLMVNGKKIELTDEQVKQLMPIAKNDPFRKPKDGEEYFCANAEGITGYHWDNDTADNEFYARGNCVLDKEIAKIMDARFVLNNLLYRFSCQNGWTEKEWKNRKKWGIRYHAVVGWYSFEIEAIYNLFDIHFVSKEIAERAIEEIVEPFVKEHPEVMPKGVEQHEN